MPSVDVVVVDAAAAAGETVLVGGTLESIGTMTFTQFVGTIATITTIGQFLSGAFTARKVWELGTPGDISPVPFISGVLGSSLWLLYGVQLSDPMMVYTNVAGIALNAFYVLVFYTYTTKKLLMSRQVLFILTLITTVTLYIYSFGAEEQLMARNRLGLICTVISLFSIASPLVTLKHVIRTKSTDSLPFPLIFSVFVVCFLWWMYALLINDYYMQVTNLLGTVISLAQLSLFLIYPSSGHLRHEKGYGNIPRT